MNTATKNLENDHIHILKLIDVMKSIVQSESPDVEHIEKIIVLIRKYADGLHHAKEENYFFPALEEKGFSPTRGPVAMMLYEHVQGRNFVKGISESVELFKKGIEPAIDDIYRNMSGYAELLTNHISKENNVLFRMADNALSEMEQKKLIDKFVSIERDQAAGENVNDYIAQINALASYYNV
jgi:hemerythrin-like domain-containing protein